MKIEEQHIPGIEQALGFKLYPWQRDYLLGVSNFVGTARASGRTTTYCIKMALSDNGPINVSRPEQYADMQDLPNHRSYARLHFMPEFLRIRGLLQRADFKVIPIINQYQPKTSNVEWYHELLYKNAYSEVVDYAKHLEDYILRNNPMIDEERLSSIRKQYIQPVTNIAKEWLGDE